jgi:hypothetical protein
LRLLKKTFYPQSTLRITQSTQRHSVEIKLFATLA